MGWRPFLRLPRQTDAARLHSFQPFLAGACRGPVLLIANLALKLDTPTSEDDLEFQDIGQIENYRRWDTNNRRMIAVPFPPNTVP
jgi:hypothetical protein